MPLPNQLAATAVPDLVATTLRNLGRLRVTDIMVPLQRLTAARNLLKKNRVEFEGGYGFQWDVIYNDAGSASNVGMGAHDNLNIVDGITQATADWRFSVANYALLEQAVSMNRGPSQIVRYVETRRIMALTSLAVLMENNFWGPPVAVNDALTPWGINTWVVKNSTEGFNGGAPSGYTTIGLNPSIYQAWQNWTYQYGAVSVDDLIRHLSKACDFTDWQPPVEGIPTFNTGDEYGLYTNYGVIGPMQELLRSQNDNAGDDLARGDGKMLFRGCPVVWVPRLEADTTNPLFGINWGWFKTFIHEDWWMKETHIPVYPGAHTISANFIDMTYQFVARNRRPLFVMALGTSYPG
jgi:hypothetical protein